MNIEQELKEYIMQLLADSNMKPEQIPPLIEKKIEELKTREGRK